MCAAMRRGFTALLISTCVHLSSACLAQDDPGRDEGRAHDGHASTGCHPASDALRSAQ